MALKDKWTDKQDNLDYVKAEDINDIAHAVIDMEENPPTGIHIGEDEPTDGSEVWIDTDEEADSGGASIDVTASVGQTIVVKEVDENGKPTKWEGADYQPRTHYKEFVDLLPETTLTYDAEAEGFVTPVDFTFTAGESYTVKYNGTEYKCTAFTYYEEGISAVMVGNGSLLGLEDTGEPFLAMTMDGAFVCMPYTELEEVVIGVQGVIFVTVPRKYLPKMYAEITVNDDEFTTGTATSHGQTKSLYKSYDVSDILDALCDGLPIYINVIGENTFDRVQVIWAEVVGAPELSSIQQVIEFLLSAGFEKSAIPIQLRAYMPSGAVSITYHINLNMNG